MLLPANTSTLSFSSMLGYASPDETARVQISTDCGGTWQDIYTEAGDNSETDSSFTQHTLSLSNYVGQSVLVRFDFDYDLTGGYFNFDSQIAGWSIENIMVTNSLKLVNLMTNSTSSTNFTFVPTQVTNYLMQARAVIFNQYPTEPGNTKEVSAVAGSPVIVLNAPTISGNQVKISFSLSAGTVSGFHLLQMDHLGGSWVTNSGAVLTTNVPGSSYQFTTTNGPPMRFFRVVTP
jgi:hypothetical protein